MPSGTQVPRGCKNYLDMDARRLCTMGGNPWYRIRPGSCRAAAWRGVQGVVRLQFIAEEDTLLLSALNADTPGRPRANVRRYALRACALVLLPAVALGGLSGCASKKRDAYNVRLTMDVESFRSRETGELPSIDVDIFAANASEEGVLQALKVREYFDTDNPYRDGLNAYRARFTNRDHEPKKLSRRGALWDSWKRKGARTLYIIANLPERPGENPELVQTRSVLALPLDRRAWPNGMFKPRTRTLKILIQPSGIVSETTQKRQ